jgi:hypothetical protein
MILGMTVFLSDRWTPGDHRPVKASMVIEALTEGSWPTPSASAARSAKGRRGRHRHLDGIVDR